MVEALSTKKISEPRGPWQKSDDSSILQVFINEKLSEEQSEDGKHNFVPKGLFMIRNSGKNTTLLSPFLSLDGRIARMKKRIIF